eukprot:scaffold1272_cov173-Ochromonas_danica.AAC.1
MREGIQDISQSLAVDVEEGGEELVGEEEAKRQIMSRSRLSRWKEGLDDSRRHGRQCLGEEERL